MTRPNSNAWTCVTLEVYNVYTRSGARWDDLLHIARMLEVD